MEPNQDSGSVTVDVAVSKSAVVEEDGTGGESSHHSSSRKQRTGHSSAHGSTGMDSSIFRFRNVNFTVGAGDTTKPILTDVSGTIKWGHVLAVMGPSGAGKTTLINTLTLDALYGRPTGRVTLNGVPLTERIFQQHCYVVTQQDKHWPYLTCRETLQYCAELYDVAANATDMHLIVEDIIAKMGLTTCADTRNGSMSGGERRRLSIGVALLKQPTLLFLDEPTTGLDAAAASNIMREIVRVAKEERLIILCTIHQPSTKVFNSFDELMILSKGREAFSGDMRDAIPYFERVGYPCPPATNPAEFYLDLVNADFSDDKAVDLILDKWEEERPEAGSSHHSRHKQGFEDDTQEGVADMKRAPFYKEAQIVFRRHFFLLIRDPILYLGRFLIFLMSASVFAFVYWNGRKDTQDQAVNKFWIQVWFISIPSQMGVVAVYALNDEFKQLIREVKNGMISPVSYLLAKFVLTLPVFFIMGVFNLVIPSYVIQDVPWESLGIIMILFACLMFTFESVAECLSIWNDDPIMGMMQYMNYWFSTFLFGGFLITVDDMYWPFKLFYYIFPFHYYIQAAIYQVFKTLTFVPCTTPGTSAVCVDSSSGLDVLGGLSWIFPVLTTEDVTAKSIGIILAIAAFFKVMYVIGVLYKSGRSSKITQG